MSYKAVLFDMDGTLLDTLEDLRDSTNHVLRQMGYPERSLEEMRRFVGNGAEKQIRRAVPEGTNEEKIMEVLTLYIQPLFRQCIRVWYLQIPLFLPGMK